MKKTLKLMLCLLVSLMMISIVQAAEIDHFKGIIDDDVTLEDEVAGSVVLAGVSAEMSGTADGVSFMLGNQVVFNGESEYVALAGNSIEVSGVVNKDAFIAGNLITIDENTELKRDVVIVGTDVEISGVIGRNVSIYATTVSLNDVKIEGDVKIYASLIEINGETEIGGNLSYPTDAEVSVDEAATIGETIETEAIAEKEESLATTLMNDFLSFISLVLVFAVLSLVGPKMFTKLQDKYDKFDFNKGLETFTKGMLFLVLVPIIVLILFLMSIGIPLALILLALYFIVVYLSTIFTGYLIGYKLWQKFFKKDINMLVVGIFGLAVLFVLNLIPGISFITAAISLFVGIGIMYDVLIKQLGFSK